MSVRLLSWLLASALTASAQQTQPQVSQPEVPEANPGRPTIATPATLTPVGFLQFETGFLSARQSPEFSSQPSINEVIKFSVSPRVELLAVTEPFVHSRVGMQTANQTGDVSVGAQGVVYQGEGARPTVALSYLRRVYNGNTPDLDVGSTDNSALFLVSADLKGFHCDSNYFFNEAVAARIRRAQFGQTLSVSHALTGKFGLTGEVWHFTQPFLRGNAVGNLWAVNYNARSNLVLDAGFNRGLTDTSTRWEVFVGVTYLLPHKIRMH